MKYLEKALELKKQLDELRPILPTQEAKIMQKFRLDWNYHSNHLEGNSLTYGETKMLLMHGITAGGKPLKDSLEIKGHNEAIKMVEDVVKQNHPLTENFIRELHLLLLKEPYEVDAITPDKKTTKKSIKIGEYKTSPNHVKTKTGEIFYFAEPFEVGAKMKDLLEEHQKQKGQKDLNPIILAAIFHYKFVRIHPFDDGNGRIARILMNFILMQFGFPPTIIKSEDKENYFLALRFADNGEIEKFVEYIAKNVVRSLEIMIAGAKGETIEDEDDLDKKIKLLQAAEFDMDKNQKVTLRSKEEILKVFDDSVVRFYNKFLEMKKKFEGFYEATENQFNYYQNPSHTLTEFRENIRNHAESKLQFFGLKRDQSFDFVSEFYFYFKPTQYEVGIYQLVSRDKISKHYGEQLSDEEINQILKAEAERHFKAIESRLKQK